ncbi:DMT family transporter [Paralimibaculum aggregatum]|uniref:DMT family transporter n=1 Tax=Paralimibaculum aggregatum TaxID=3036245 RepID=A0ABQ6LTR0_9RHOB|nr:DMT family transporter [Limibaculum sp. NKW23]GMG85480.1 DMT family transporter [Limibaculum sp. NKW23]
MTGSGAGAIWITGGMAAIALTDNLMPLVAERLSLWHFHALRAALVLPAVLALAAFNGHLARLRPQAPRRLAERTGFAVLAMLLYFAALPAVGIAQASAGLFTSPIWVVIFEWVLHGERMGPRRLGALALGAGGVWLVLDPGTGPGGPMALVAVASGAAYALGLIWTGRYCRAESAVALSIWLFVGLGAAGLLGIAARPWLAEALAGVPGTGFATRPWDGLDAATLGWIAVIGLGGMTASICLAQGYKMGEASLMALFDFSFLLWAPLFAWAIWGSALAPQTALGMALIVGAGALAVWSGARRRTVTAGADPRVATARAEPPPDLPGGGAG